MKGVFNTSNETKYEKDQPEGISIDFNFYKIFWNLQEYFCNTASLSTAPTKWQKFTSTLMFVLNTFEAQPLNEQKGSCWFKTKSIFSRPPIYTNNPWAMQHVPSTMNPKPATVSHWLCSMASSPAHHLRHAWSCWNKPIFEATIPLLFWPRIKGRQGSSCTSHPWPYVVARTPPWDTTTSPLMPAHSPHQHLGLFSASHAREREPSHAITFLEPWAPKSAARIGILCLLNSAKTWEKFLRKDRSFKKSWQSVKEGVGSYFIKGGFLVVWKGEGGSR